MFSQAFSVVYYALSSIFSIFSNLVERLGFGGILLTLFTIYTVVRLLLIPLFGRSFGAGSDTVDSAAHKVKEREHRPYRLNHSGKNR